MKNFVQAAASIHNFFIDNIAPLPDDFKEKLRELLVEQAAGPFQARLVLELIYARKDDLPVEMLQIGLQLTQLMVNYQQLGYQNGRGQGIVDQLLAMPGVEPAAPVEARSVPKPDPQFVPSEETAPLSAPEAEAPPVKLGRQGKAR